MIEFVFKTYYPIGLIDYFAKILFISKNQNKYYRFFKPLTYSGSR